MQEKQQNFGLKWFSSNVYIIHEFAMFIEDHIEWISRVLIKDRGGNWGRNISTK